MGFYGIYHGCPETVQMFIEVSNCWPLIFKFFSVTPISLSESVDKGSCAVMLIIYT